ncbi:hypothetical protein OEA41_004067 [Lepraria neglecta]|uniref:Cyclin-D1-binding protein 1-like N-terminal domain-containing protein n=1 Tax=Lepraria neglecta TaxID=209136 RepID=A0AAD9Z9J6_9LECA|nr:hypothetical protein OEA41_004067 [Lepraria neglecta]
MAPSKDADGLATLQATIASITALIQSFQTALQFPISSHADIQDPPNPLALLSDASKILKAQTTKLSLLILNKPFTPSAITFVLNSLSNSCLPGLISALELCPAAQYSRLLHQHIRSSLLRIMMELLNLIESIPQDEHGIEKTGRGTLASTGVLWQECDKMVDLASTGLVKLANQKVEESHGLLKDAIEELEAWDPDEEDIDSDTDSVSSSNQNPTPVPSHDESILASTLGNLSLSPAAALRKRTLVTLRTVRVLYPALKKRRISTFPNISSNSTLDALPTPPKIRALDSLADHTLSFTESADEVAGALYEGDEEQVERRLETLREAAEGCVMAVKRGWKDEEDEFTGWAEKWVARLKEVGRE